MKNIFRSRRHRNAHTHEESSHTPYFSKVNAIPVQKKNNPYFSRNNTAIQTKLTIGKPGDKYEKEADSVADSVVNRSASSPVIQQNNISNIQRTTLMSPIEDEKLGTAEARMEKDKLIQEMPESPSRTEEPEENLQAMHEEGPEMEEETIQSKEEEDTLQEMPEEEKLQEKEEEEDLQAKSNGHGGTASPSLTQKLQSAKGGGRPLSADTQSEMESSIGADFRDVKIHTGSSAKEMNQELNAKAFTHGQDVYFNSGNYNPESTEGKRLLAHELTHVVQQKGDGLSKHKANPMIARETKSDNVKKKGNFDLFKPSIKGSVGEGGKNNPEDVKVIQRLLISQGYFNLTPSSDINPETIEAIRDFQKKTFPKWKKHDGRVDVGRSTWKALAKAYFKPDDTKRERKEFPLKKNILVSPEDITKAAKSGLAFVEDDDKDNLDDALGWNRQAANKTAGVASIPVKNIKHLTWILQKYYDSGVSIGTLAITSHGSYRRHAFLVGNEVISASRISRLRPLKNLLAPSTQLVVLACHVGGGSNPEAGKLYTKKLAETLGVTVYTSRSWSIGSKNLFNTGSNNTYASYFGDPSKYSKSDIRNRPNVYKFLGEWVKATPGEEKTKVEVINALKFNKNGEISIAKERFPTFNKKKALAYVSVLKLALSALKK